MRKDRKNCQSTPRNWLDDRDLNQKSNQITQIQNLGKGLEDSAVDNVISISFLLNYVSIIGMTEPLTGARANALNINSAPNISIRKPTSQVLFKAYALMTCKHNKIVNKYQMSYLCQSLIKQ